MSKLLAVDLFCGAERHFQKVSHKLVFKLILLTTLTKLTQKLIN